MVIDKAVAFFFMMIILFFATSQATETTEIDPLWSANFTNMQIDSMANNYIYGIYGNGSWKIRPDLVNGTGGTGSNSTYNATYDALIPYVYNYSLVNIWENWLDNAISIINQNKNVYLFNNISFNRSGGSGILGYTSPIVNINYTFNSTTETTEADFSRGSLNNTDITTQSGNITLSSGELIGNYTSMVFDLGQYPNMSTLSWGHNIPHQSYYFTDNLTFGWDGSVNYSYVNNIMPINMTGGIITGNNYSIFPDNNATYFDGVNDALNYSGNLISNTTTITAWVYPNSYGEGGFGRIVDNGALNFEVSSVSARLLYGKTQGATTAFSATDSILPNNWYHVALVRKQTGTTTSTINFYINGVLSGDANQAGTTIVDGTYTMIGNKFSNDRTFNGTLDEVHIWNNRVLSAGEINSLYNISIVNYPITLQTRSDNTNIGWANWTNTTTMNGYYSNSTSENINRTGLNFDRQYFQYRVLFDSLNVTLSNKYIPILNWVNFSYISNSSFNIPSQPMYGNTSNLTTIYSVEGQLKIKNENIDNLILTTTGTLGYLGKWTSSNVLGNSIMSESGNTINVAGNMDITGDYKVNGAQGITKTIQVVNYTNLITVSYCNMTFTGGILTYTNC